MKKTVNVGIVGTQFMGCAHSNAWMDVDKFYDLPVQPVMKAACDNVPENLGPFCERFGWQSQETRWEDLVARADIDIIDICTSNATHRPIAVAAAAAGKHIICEKPIAMNAAEAKTMLEAVQAAGVKHMVAFNYRRVPAIALAKEMIAEGKIGRVFHFNAVYYQDWLVDPGFPYVWRHDKQVAGSGAHGDMNAHIVDLARFLVGEVTAVCGAEEVFVKERRMADGSGMGRVTADDALFSLARFDQGALGSFMATRFASGRKNFLRFDSDVGGLTPGTATGLVEEEAGVGQTKAFATVTAEENGYSDTGHPSGTNGDNGRLDKFHGIVDCETRIHMTTGGGDNHLDGVIVFRFKYQ